jgi:hypothetical protein
VIAAPTARRRLRRVPLVLFKVAVFTLGALALEAVALINLALSVIWNQ